MEINSFYLNSLAAIAAKFTRNYIIASSAVVCVAHHILVLLLP